MALETRVELVCEGGGVVSASENLRASVARYREHNDRIAAAHGVGRSTPADHFRQAQEAIYRSRRLQAQGDWQATTSELREAIEHLRAGLVQK